MFGLGNGHRFERSKKRMQCCLSKLAVVSGAEDGQDVVNVLFPSKKNTEEEVPTESQDVKPDEECATEAIITYEPQKKAYDRKAQDSPTLAQVVEVVQYGLSLEPGIPKQKQCRLMYPNILRSNILAKWCQKYFRYRLWLMDTAASSRLRSVPNWWIQEQGLQQPLKGRTTIAGIPRSVAELVDKAQTECTVGLTMATKRSDAGQGPLQLRRSMVEAMTAFNKSSDELRSAIQDENKAAWEDFKVAVMQSDDADGTENQEKPLSKRKVAKEIRKLQGRVRKIPKDWSQWKPNPLTVRRFNRYFQNSRSRTNTAGNFLSFDDPRMIHARQQVKDIVKRENIPWELVLTLGKVIYVYM